MKVFLKYTEGCCWRRLIDFKLIEKFFSNNGCEIVDQPEKADLICLETCAFVKRTEDIAIREIKEIQDKKLGGKLMVLGCLPGINMDRLREIFDGVAINTKDLEDINKQFPEFKNKFTFSCDENNLFCQKMVSQTRITLLSILRFFFRSFNFSGKYFANIFSNFLRIFKANMGLNRKIYYLRVGWGCAEPHCSFCVEWQAVGSNMVSKSYDDCIKEVREGLKQGYHHYAIIADNPGAWGWEFGKNLPALLKDILALDPKIVISNIDGIHPFWMLKYKDELVELLKSGRIKSIMSALQSGNNRILGLMNRRYTREQYLQMMKEIRAAYKDIILITQIIVGFPSETFEEFKESVDLVIEANFTNVTLFPFYCNPTTPAAKLDNRLDDAEKFRRVNYGLDAVGKKGILSFNLGVEIDPRFQKTKAIYYK